MKFTQFKLKELPGKLVVWTCSNVKGEERTKIITPIETCTKQGFTLQGYPDRTFSFFTGKEIFTNTKNIPAISFCELTDPSKVDSLQAQWRNVKHKEELISIIRSNVSKLHVLPFDTLKSVVDQLSILYENIKTPQVADNNLHTDVNIKANTQKVHRLLRKLQDEHNQKMQEIFKEIDQLKSQILTK